MVQWHYRSNAGRSCIQLSLEALPRVSLDPLPYLGPFWVLLLIAEKSIVHGPFQERRRKCGRRIQSVFGQIALEILELALTREHSGIFGRLCSMYIDHCTSTLEDPSIFCVVLGLFFFFFPPSLSLAIRSCLVRTIHRPDRRTSTSGRSSSRQWSLWGRKWRGRG